MTGLKTRALEKEKEILQTRKGLDAADLDREMGEWLDSERKALEGKYTSQRQRELFARQFEPLKSSAVGAMFRYSFKEVEQAEKLSREKQNESFLFECETRYLANDAKVQENRTLRHANIRANLKGQSEDVIAAAIRDSDRELYERMVQGHAARSLDNALEYLERDDVRSVFSPAELKETSAKLLAAKKQQDDDAMDTEASLYAIERMDNGATLAEMQTELLQKYGKDRGGLAYQQAVTRNALEKTKQAEVAQEQTEQTWNQFFESGQIPEGVNHKDKLTMLKMAEKKATGKPSGAPWAFGQHLLDNYTPEQLQEVKRNGGWGEIMARLCPGGKQTDIYKDVVSYSRGEKQGSGNGDGDLSGTMTPERYARQKFIKVTGIRPASAKGAQEFNTFMDYFVERAEDRARELELKNVKHLPRAEQDNILTELLTEGDWGYSWQPNFLSRDKFRYQVMDQTGYEDYFHPKERQRLGEMEQPQEAVPTRSGAGPRDVSRETQAGLEITTPAGVVQHVENGKVKTYFPRPKPEPEEPPRPPLPGFLEKWNEMPDGKVEWTGNGWMYSSPVTASYFVDLDGNVMNI